MVKEAFVDNAVLCNAKNVFYLEPESRWDFLIVLVCSYGECLQIIGKFTCDCFYG